MEFHTLMEAIAQGLELIAVAIIVIGGALAVIHGFRNAKGLDHYFSAVRRAFGRPLILGLEILVAADIVQTITVELSLSSVSTLAILVAVRIALSFSLEIELDGALPWRRTEIDALRAKAPHRDES